MQTALNRLFAPIKRHAPTWFWAPFRRVMNALLGPALFSVRSGHFRSSLKDLAVAADGSPLPWYTYPAIAFLEARDFSSRRVLEFGAGQSTLWWARRAAEVLSFDESEEWVARVLERAPRNVSVRFSPLSTPAECVAGIERALADAGRFDVVVIDGLWRFELIPLALRALAPDGIVICDNSDGEGYEFRRGFSGSGMARVDFFGMCPARAESYYCTSIFFGPGAYAFGDHPIP